MLRLVFRLTGCFGLSAASLDASAGTAQKALDFQAHVCYTKSMDDQSIVNLLREGKVSAGDRRVQRAWRDYEMAIQQAFYERLDTQFPQLSTPLQTLIQEGDLTPEEIVDATLAMLGGQQSAVLFSVQELLLTITMATNYIKGMRGVDEE